MSEIDKLPQIFANTTIEVECPHCGYQHVDNEILDSNDDVYIDDIFRDTGASWYFEKIKVKCSSCGEEFTGEIR